MKKSHWLTRFLVIASMMTTTCIVHFSAAAADLRYAPAPADNPLKGFIPYSGVHNNFPHSMEWFYLSLKDVQTGYDSFNWNNLETKLNAVAKRGHQAVFRIYLDYPDQPYGVPVFLDHVPKHSYTDSGNGTHHTSYSPDYENADLRRAVKNFIAAFGKRYDGDPRVGFITIGMLGFWGEWHTYPHLDWMASTTVQNEVLTSFDNAFNVTKVLLREPKADTNAAQRRIGYHDDSFAYETLSPPEWHFWGKVVAQGVTDIWKTEPIGGELRPEVQSCIWNDVPCTPQAQSFDRCVQVTHCSWLINHGAFSGLSRARYQRAVEGARKLGYELYASSVEINPVTATSALQATVKVRNMGVAPFYYDWKLRIGVMNEAGNLVKQWNTNWKLTGILPAMPDKAWKLNQAHHGLKPGRYRLLLRVVNPLSGGRALKFANATQDRDLPEWLSLGSFAVSVKRK